MDRLDPVLPPADSLYFRAYFECDSAYNVLLRNWTSNSSSGQVDMKFDDGRLNLEYKTDPDTIWMKGRDSLIYVPVKGDPIPVNQLTWMQELWIRIGKFFSGIVTLILFIFIIRIIQNKYVKK